MHSPEEIERVLVHAVDLVRLGDLLTLHSVTAADEGQHGLDVHERLRKAVVQLVSGVLQSLRLAQVIHRFQPATQRGVRRRYEHEPRSE